MGTNALLVERRTGTLRAKEHARQFVMIDNSRGHGGLGRANEKSSCSAWYLDGARLRRNRGTGVFNDRVGTLEISRVNHVAAIKHDRFRRGGTPEKKGPYQEAKVRAVVAEEGMFVVRALVENVGFDRVQFPAEDLLAGFRIVVLPLSGVLPGDFPYEGNLGGGRSSDLFTFPLPLFCSCLSLGVCQGLPYRISHTGGSDALVRTLHSLSSQCTSCGLHEHRHRLLKRINTLVTQAISFKFDLVLVPDSSSQPHTVQRVGCLPRRHSRIGKSDAENGYAPPLLRYVS